MRAASLLTLSAGIVLLGCKAKEAQGAPDSVAAAAVTPARAVTRTAWGAGRDTTRLGLSKTLSKAEDDGVIVVSDSTTGPIDSLQTYTVDFDDGVTSGFFGIGYSMTTDHVPHGPHKVLLGNVPPSCAVADANPRAITVSGPDTVRVVFHVHCT